MNIWTKKGCQSKKSGNKKERRLVFFKGAIDKFETCTQSLENASAVLKILLHIYCININEK